MPRLSNLIKDCKRRSPLFHHDCKVRVADRGVAVFSRFFRRNSDTANVKPAIRKPKTIETNDAVARR